MGLSDDTSFGDNFPGLGIIIASATLHIFRTYLNLNGVLIGYVS